MIYDWGFGEKTQSVTQPVLAISDPYPKSLIPYPDSSESLPGLILDCDNTLGYTYSDDDIEVRITTRANTGLRIIGICDMGLGMWNTEDRQIG